MYVCVEHLLWYGVNGKLIQLLMGLSCKTTWDSALTSLPLIWTKLRFVADSTKSCIVNNFKPSERRLHYHIIDLDKYMDF